MPQKAPRRRTCTGIVTGVNVVYSRSGLGALALLDAEFLSRLQLKGVPFDFPDDVLLRLHQCATADVMKRTVCLMGR